MKKIYLYLCFFFIGLLIMNCKKELSYAAIAKQELSKSERADYLFDGIYLGMTFKDFYEHCRQMNQKGVFVPNANQSGVQALLNAPFNAPVIFEFFPIAQTTNGPIVKVNASLKYRDFSFYGEQYAIKNLVKEAMDYYVQELGGREFIAIPQKNKLIKNYFVKLDSNRRITLIPSVDGSSLRVIFEDLSQLKEPMPIGV